MVRNSFYSVSEVAEILQCNPETVRDYIRDGKLRAHKPMWQLLVPIEELDRLINRSKIRNSRELP